MNVMRGGMQVHAVPDNERATDANGRRLPWAFEYADSDISRRRDQEERGPFGRSTRRRGFSRSKTATPARKEDVQRIENMQAEDAIFNNYKASQKTRDALVTSKSVPMLTLDGNMKGAGGTAIAKEATELILFGYGKDMEWAAIDFYERVSGGSVLEDYDREPPTQKYDLSRSLSRAAAQRSLSKAALKKRNTYKGGAHWIKVTFDSPEAADLACDRSPHTIQGYLVYAEPYRGVPPPNDSPIPATNAGAQIDSGSLPSSFSTNTLSKQPSSDSPESSMTGASATVTNPIPMKDLRTGLLPPQQSALQSSRSAPQLGSLVPVDDTQPDHRQIRQRPLRIQGATRAVLKSADQALMPSQPKSSGIFAFLLAILFLGQKNDAGSSQVPRLEDGSLDWKNASLYWQFFAWLDGILGTDMCGLRVDR